MPSPTDCKHAQQVVASVLAYVEARYNPGYKITKPQLEHLAGRVKKLQRLTKSICEARIESYLSA